MAALDGRYERLGAARAPGEIDLPPPASPAKCSKDEADGPVIHRPEG
jgi:hypothetical protein